MAPMVREDTMEMLDDVLDLLKVNFDEISSLATLENPFDDSNLVMDNGLLGISQALQPASPVPQPPLVGQDAFIYPVTPPASPECMVLQDASTDVFLQQTLSPSVVPQQALSPEPCNIQVQPASPASQPQEYFIPPATPPASPEFLVLQPANAEPFLQETHIPLSVPQQVLSPKPCIMQVQPVSPQTMDLSELSGSLELLTPSLADSFMQSPLSLWQQDQVKEEEAAVSSTPQQAASPASQQTADAPKKRGRKRKYSEDAAPSCRRARKPKLYELEPLPDQLSEKKRKNAVNAKRHRDKEKCLKQKLSMEMAEVRAQSDILQQKINHYQHREQQLLQVLSMYGIKIEGLEGL